MLRDSALAGDPPAGQGAQHRPEMQGSERAASPPVPLGGAHGWTQRGRLLAEPGDSGRARLLSLLGVDLDTAEPPLNGTK